MSATLAQSQLDAMRTTLASTFVDTATLYRKGAGRSAGGGVVDAYAPVSAATNVPCRCAPTARLPKETATTETEFSEASWMLHLPRSTGPADVTNFTANDRWLVTITETGNVMTFEITFVIPDRSFALERRAIVKLVA